MTLGLCVMGCGRPAFHARSGLCGSDCPELVIKDKSRMELVARAAARIRAMPGFRGNRERDPVAPKNSEVEKIVNAEDRKTWNLGAFA